MKKGPQLLEALVDRFQILALAFEVQFFGPFAPLLNGLLLLLLIGLFGDGKGDLIAGQMLKPLAQYILKGVEGIVVVYGLGHGGSDESFYPTSRSLRCRRRWGR